jgi:predicted alpha/beta superfamily hydrolase
MKYFKTLLIVLVLCVISKPNIGQITGDGKFVRINLFTSEYVNARNIDIWLPSNFSTNKKYAVLYMHDGQMLFDSAQTWNKQEWKVDEVMSNLLNENKIIDCIVVGIWNDGQYRHADYYPEKSLKYLPDSIRNTIVDKDLKGNPTADEYLKFIVKELKPYIDEHFPTYPDKEHTFIAGSSMGGLISLYAFCEYPDIFGGAACISTHWPGTFMKEDRIPESFIEYITENLPVPDNRKIYFDYGSETLDKFYEPWQKKVDVIMKNNGYNALTWTTKSFPSADHSEKSWADRLDIPLLFLLGKK